jgi:hypothetical protein
MLRRILERIGANHVEQRWPCVSRQFTTIRGNTNMVTARVIGLGEEHTLAHARLIGQFVNRYARSGDIVLIEGAPSSVKQEEGGLARTRYGFRKNLMVVGWDDMALVRAAEEGERESHSIYASMVANRDNPNEYRGLRARFWSLRRERADVKIRQRNASMMRCLHEMRGRFPQRRIFIVAGMAHFLKDGDLIENLQKERFLILGPRMKSSREDKFQRARRRFG